MQLHMRVSRFFALSSALLLLAIPPLAQARGHSGGEDRVAIFNTITVHENEDVGDVACMFCTVNLDGDVHGDVAVMFATVNTATDRTISGDVATLFSTLRVGDNTHIHGDLAAALSNVQLAPSAVVDGDKKLLSSGLGVGLLLAPLLLLAGFIWMAVWLVRRLLYPAYYR